MTLPERVTVDSVITPEIRAEAQSAAEQCKRGADDLWTGLARMVECSGWVALGYQSFRSWAKAELGLTEGTAGRRLRDTKILLALQQETGLPVAQLASKARVRRRRPGGMTENAKTLRLAARKMSVAIAIVTPDERQAAVELRDHLNRLLT